LFCLTRNAPVSRLGLAHSLVQKLNLHCSFNPHNLIPGNSQSMKQNGGPYSSSPVNIAFQAAGPEQETQQLPLGRPHESEDLARRQRFGGHPRIRLYAPAQILAAPRREAMAAGCIPEES
jgi:hypothetical protein